MPVDAQVQKLALRIDDIGASSKEHLYYTKRWYTNWGPLRDRRLFGKWAPYREMTARDWEHVFAILRRHGSKLTVGITATWAEADGTLVPFPDKFPREAQAIGEGVAAGLLEIANHGLTHCVLANRQYRRRLGYGSNRMYHREFWDWVSPDLQRAQLTRAQEILTRYYGVEITTFVPPGNVYSEATLAICDEIGFRILNCERPRLRGATERPRVIGDDQVVPFHDRELVIFGTDWLEHKIRSLPQPPDRFVRDL